MSQHSNALQFIEMFPNIQPGLIYDVVSSSKDDEEILEKLMTLNEMPQHQAPPQGNRNNSSNQPPAATRPTAQGGPPGYPGTQQQQQPQGYPQANRQSQQQQPSGLPPGYPGSNTSRPAAAPTQPQPAPTSHHGYGAPTYGSANQRQPQQTAPQPAANQPTPNYTNPSVSPIINQNPAQRPSGGNTFKTSSSGAPAGRQQQAQPTQHAPPPSDVSPSAVKARQAVNDMLNRPQPKPAARPTGYDAAFSGNNNNSNQGGYSRSPTTSQPTTADRERDYAQLAAEQAARDAAEALRLAHQPAVEPEPPKATTPKLPPGLAASQDARKAGDSQPQPQQTQRIESSGSEDEDPSSPEHVKHSGDKGGGWFNPFGLFGGGKKDKKDKHEKKPEPKKEAPKRDQKKPTTGAAAPPAASPTKTPPSVKTVVSAPALPEPETTSNNTQRRFSPPPEPAPFSAEHPTQLAGKFSFNETGHATTEPSVNRRKFDNLFAGFAHDQPEEVIKKTQEASVMRKREQEAAEREAQKSAPKLSFGVATSSNVKDAPSYQSLFEDNNGNGSSSKTGGGGGTGSSHNFSLNPTSSTATVGNSYNFADPVGNSMSKRAAGMNRQNSTGGGGPSDDLWFSSGPSSSSGPTVDPIAALTSGTGGASSGTSTKSSGAVTGGKSFDALLAGFE